MFPNFFFYYHLEKYLKKINEMCIIIIKEHLHLKEKCSKYFH